jgi:hypothetical protein
LDSLANFEHVRGGANRGCSPIATASRLYDEIDHHVFSFGCCAAHALRFASSFARFHSTQASFVSSWRRNTSLPSQ